MSTNLEQLAREVESLLMAAKCPACDGSGHIPVPLGEHHVSHEMAIDAGDPGSEGQSMGIEWGDSQCEWCARKDEAITALQTATAQAKEELELYRMAELPTMQLHLFGNFLGGGSPTPLLDYLRKAKAARQQEKA